VVDQLVDGTEERHRGQFEIPLGRLAPADRQPRLGLDELAEPFPPGDPVRLDRRADSDDLDEGDLGPAWVGRRRAHVGPDRLADPLGHRQVQCVAGDRGQYRVVGPLGVLLV